MEPKVFTEQEIAKYFASDKPHELQERSVKKLKEMRVHSDGTYPAELVDERRPNESKEVQEYRKKIWEPKTKPTFGRVFNALQRIRRSQDWGVQYPANESDFPLIPENESMQQYCEKKFPYFDSVTNWMFSVYLRKYLIDANAIVLVQPLNKEKEENEFYRPMPKVYESDIVLDFVEDEYVVIKNTKGSRYLHEGKEMQGKSIFILTSRDVLRYDQVKVDGTFSLAEQSEHGLDVLPAFKTKGIYVDSADMRTYYEPRLADMLPELNEALREYSDLQAAKVLHLYPERWEYSQNECHQCKGTGRRPNPEWYEGSNYQREHSCEQCEGRGYVVAGPYSKIIVRPPQSGMESAVPTPPVGYAEKDVEIIKVMEESVNKHIRDALAAVNLDMLDAVPMSESGVAKQVDRDESNNTVHGIAEDIVWAMDRIYRLIALYRYGGLYATDEIERMLPIIGVPEKYDLFSASSLQQEIKTAKEAKQNPILLNALEIEFSAKRFAMEPAVKEELTLCLMLDPLPNVPEDEKVNRLQNKGITQITYILSSNIQQFVRRALMEVQGFAAQPVDQQKAKLTEYAQQQLDAESAVRVIMPEDQGDEEFEENQAPDNEIQEEEE